MSTAGTDAEHSRAAAPLTGPQQHDDRPYSLTAARRRPSRPVPSPLQESTTARSASDLKLSTHSPSPAAASARAAHSQEYVSTTANALRVERVRAPNPGKKAPSNPQLDAFRSAVTRDALKEAADKAAPTGQLRTVTTPPPAHEAVTHASPPASPTMISSSRTASRTDPRLADGRSIMPRQGSIDSAVSSISSSTTMSQKPGGTGAYRVPHESAGPQDVAALIAAAGSAEAVVQKLLNDKNQAASHNAQLWRLVEKQRAMILGLNTDLEKTLKEKERYRRKLKDHMVHSPSAPVLPSVGEQADDMDMRDGSVSPEPRDVRSTATGPPTSMRGFGMENRRVSDASDATSVGYSRSDTPQDFSNLPSSTGLPTTPHSASSSSATARDAVRPRATPGMVQTENAAGAHVSGHRLATATPPLSPRNFSIPSSPKGFSKPPTPTGTTAGFANLPHGISSPKSAVRKAPPAPLQLSPKHVVDVTSSVASQSDSEYEDDPDSARADQKSRGRRKTREEDDRERESVAEQEAEYRSQSKRDRKSKSKSKTRPALQPEVPSDAPNPLFSQPAAVERTPEPIVRTHVYPPLDPVTIMRHRALSGEEGGLPKSITAPDLMSPGLPMSPRPIDKPLNSPMPRAPNKMVISMPLSPRNGMPAGLPLSPRAPRQAIPLPPQTPLTFSSPHLARAEAYHQQAQTQQISLVDRLKPSPNSSPESEQPSASSDVNPKSPGEVYKGLVTEQYPDLLLPPNALPSIYVKTSSSRMKPSRQSYIAPKLADENPVLTLAVHERSDNKQLWRVEKTLAALSILDTQIKSVSAFRDRLPDRTLFAGHAPARMDARRAAVDAYFDRMLDCVQDERAAKIMCRFLSTSAIGAEGGDYFGVAGEPRPDTPVAKLRPQRAGYLTKRGKNFGGWKARYFILSGPNLKYYESPGGAHLGSIKLQSAQIGKQSQHGTQATQEDEDNQFRHAFLILEPKKKDSSSLVRHVLCAESDEERDAWVEALLQFVDCKDEEEEPAKSTQYLRPGHDVSGARSPRLQKSMNDLRPPIRPKDIVHLGMDPLRAMHYNDTVPGEAPVIGPGGARKLDTPSPPHDGSFAGSNEQTPSNHITISAPTNLQYISNAGDWGMRAPPTPQPKDFSKEKKRSMFSAFRGRSSSDLAPGVSSPAFPHDQRQTRAVFGVPLAEAVLYACPVDVSTELPAVVYRSIEYLTLKNAIAEEGIFRLSGSNTVIRSLKDRFNMEGDVNLAGEDTYYDIHAVASLLKLYLRELPASILTRESHLEFLQCLEMQGGEKIAALKVLVNRLPRPNRALLHALSAFLLAIVNNADVNKMNVRNVGIVFAPTLNVPAPLISCFVEDLGVIFGPPTTHEAEPSATISEFAASSSHTDLRFHRKQKPFDAPTPASYHYHPPPPHQVHLAHHQASSTETHLASMQPAAYSNYQMPPQGEGGFGSLNDALRTPTLHKPSLSVSDGQALALPPPPLRVGAKSKRRESGMMLLPPNTAPVKKTSMSRLRDGLREGEGASF